MKKAKPGAISPRQFVAREFRKLTAPVNVEFLEANGISKASLEAGIAEDRKMLETIEPGLGGPLAGSLRGLKRAVLNGIKIREKLLKLIEESSGKAK